MTHVHDINGTREMNFAEEIFYHIGISPKYLIKKIIKAILFILLGFVLIMVSIIITCALFSLIY